MLGNQEKFFEIV